MPVVVDHVVCVEARALVDCQANDAGGRDVNRRPIKVFVRAMGQAIEGVRRQASVGDPKEKAGKEIGPVQLSIKPARNKRLLIRPRICCAIFRRVYTSALQTQDALTLECNSQVIYNDLCLQDLRS